MLIITTLRPENDRFVARIRAMFGTGSRATYIQVNPLSPEAVTSLVAGTMHQQPQDVGPLVQVLYRLVLTFSGRLESDDELYELFMQIDLLHAHLLGSASIGFDLLPIDMPKETPFPREIYLSLSNDTITYVRPESVVIDHQSC